MPKPTAVTQSARATVHGNMVYVSGTGATQNETEPLSTMEETLGALENVAKILHAANSSVDRIVNVTMLLSDPHDYADCNEAYVEFFKRHGENLPSRSTAKWGGPPNLKVAFGCIAATRE